MRASAPTERIPMKSTPPHNDPRPPTAPEPRARRLPIAGLVVAVAAASAGCQGGTGVLRRWSTTRDETLAKPLTDAEYGDAKGLVGRWLNPKAPMSAAGTERVDPLLAFQKREHTAEDKKAEDDFKAAFALYQQGKLSEAEKQFDAIDRAQIEKKGTVVDRLFADTKAKKGDGADGIDVKSGRRQSSVGEKALFYLAECQYQQGQFVRADASYQKLMNTYPGSPHLDIAVKRQFAIACAWLDAGDPKAKPEHPPSWFDHFNGRMPLIDVDGYAIKALEHVRVQDPTGPLADVATMKIAEHHMKVEAWEDASSTYDLLISDYPKSKLLRQAQLGSIDAKMKNYLGPAYDSEGLEQARKLIKQVLNDSPERQASTNDKLYHDLDLIADQQAEIAFRNGQFYKQTGYVSGAEFYFGEVRSRWPKSPWAEKSKVEMAGLAKMKRKQALPSKILLLPGAPDPSSVGNSSGSMATNPGGMMGGGGGMPTGGGPN